MASAGVNFYECAICLNDLIGHNPKLLQCGHTFCLECLQRLAQGRGITCPTCRAVTMVPPDGAKALTNNFQLIQMHDREQEMMKKMKKMNMGV